MHRLAFFLVFIPLAMLAAGLFGAVHDQISYSVSPEYFTKFKFLQFGLLNTTVPERVRAAQVGFLASWWMGVPLGILCGAAGLIQRTRTLMWRALVLSLFVAVLITLITALAGLGYGWQQTQHISVTGYYHWLIPQDVNNQRAFLCVGYMHNAAYLGGALSIFVVWIFNIAFRRYTIDQGTVLLAESKSGN